MLYKDPFLNKGYAQGFGKAKNKELVEQKIIEAESEPPLPSKNRYQDPLEILKPPVDYHDAKAMLVYLSDAPERTVWKRNYFTKLGIKLGLFAAFLILILIVLFFVCSGEIRFVFTVFFSKHFNRYRCFGAVIFCGAFQL